MGKDHILNFGHDGFEVPMETPGRWCRYGYMRPVVPGVGRGWDLDVFAMVSFQTLSLGGSIKGVGVNRGEKSLRRPRKWRRGSRGGKLGSGGSWKPPKETIRKSRG